MGSLRWSQAGRDLSSRFLPSGQMWRKPCFKRLIWYRGGVAKAKWAGGDWKLWTTEWEASHAFYIGYPVKNPQDRPLAYSSVFRPNSFHFCINFSLCNFLWTAILGIHKHAKLCLCHYVCHIIEHLIVYVTVSFTHLSLTEGINYQHVWLYFCHVSVISEEDLWQ